LDGRLSDIQKKYDDSKKAYFKSKEERERLRQELEKFAGQNPTVEPSQFTEI
jgi:hypothetical protein